MTNAHAPLKSALTADYINKIKPSDGVVWDLTPGETYEVGDRIRVTSSDGIRFIATVTRVGLFAYQVDLKAA